MKFTPEDFAMSKAPNGYVAETSGMLRQWICSVANARLEEMLREAPEVFGAHVGDSRGFEVWFGGHTSGTTHRARLVCIELLET